MARKEDVDFYRSFSRKELQSLCKKYGLPANRSSSDMAESLASYFEKSSLTSLSLGMGLSGIQEASLAASLVLPMQTGPPTNAIEDVRKDCYSTKVVTIGEDYSRTTTFGESDCGIEYQEPLGGLTGPPLVPQFSRNLNNKVPTTNSLRDWLANRPQSLKREMNDGECPQESGSPGSSTIPCSSSFEFYVSSEEGINLCVDLNFNLSDWIDKLKSDVSVCDNMCRKKSRSSNQGTDNLTENNERTKSQSPSYLDAVQGKDGHVVKASSLSPVMKENGQVPSDHPCSGEGSLASSAIEPCSRVIDASDHCKEDEGLDLSVLDYAAPGQIASCTESCSKTCCMISLHLDCVNSPQKKLASDSVMDAADFPMNLDTLNHPVVKLPNEISENPSPESPHKLGNSSSVTPICPGGVFSEISSSGVKVYQTYPSCSPRKTCKSPDFIDPNLIADTEPDGYSVASEFHFEERSEIISGREQLE